MHLLKSEGSLHIHNLALNPNFNNLLEEFSLTKYFGMEVQCVLWVAETKFHILFRWGSYIKGRAVAQVVRVSPRRLGFHSGPVHVRFVVAKTALEPVSIRIFQISLVWVIPPMVYTDIRHNTALFSKKSWRILRKSELSSLDGHCKDK